MRRQHSPSHVLLTTALLAVALAASVAQAKNAPAADSPRRDDIPHALGKKQSKLRRQGLELLLRGQRQAVGKNKVVEVAKGQFVELAREKQDLIWTVTGQ